jgi:DNA-binding MarR family transcriptional regulator
MYMQHLTSVSASDDEPQRLADEVRRACVGVRVGHLHRLVSRRYDEALRPLGVTLTQMEILGVLILMPAPARPATLANMLGVERSTMSRNLDLLEKRGYVSTAETSPSGRSLRIAVTAEGRALHAATEGAWREAQQSLVDRLGTDVVSTLDRWLVELNEAA